MKTYADVANRLRKYQERNLKILKDPKASKLDKESARLNLESIEKLAGDTYNDQEAQKKPQQGMTFPFGGIIPTMANGGTPEDYYDLIYDTDPAGDTPITAPLDETEGVSPNVDFFTGQPNIQQPIALNPSLGYQATPRLMTRKGFSFEQPIMQKRESSGMSAPELAGPNAPQEDYKPSYLDFVPGAINMARGLFGKAEKVDPSQYQVTGRYTPTQIDTSEQQREIEVIDATNRRNASTMSPTQNMAAQIAAGDWKAKAMSSLAQKKREIEIDSMLKAKEGNIGIESQNKQIAMQVDEQNRQNEAARQNLQTIGMEQLTKALQAQEVNKMMYDRLAYDRNYGERVLKQRENESKRYYDQIDADRKQRIDEYREGLKMLENKDKSIINPTEPKKETQPETLPPETLPDNTREDLDKWLRIAQGVTPKPENLTEQELAEIDRIKDLLDNDPYFKILTKPVDQKTDNKTGGVQTSLRGKYHNDPKAVAQIQRESSWVDIKWNPESGALGIGQFMPAAAEQYGLKVHPKLQGVTDTTEVARITRELMDNRELNATNDDRLNPELALKARDKYMEDAKKKYGDTELAYASYNAGPGNVDKAISKAGSRDWNKVKRYLPEETRKYVDYIFSEANKEIANKEHKKIQRGYEEKVRSQSLASYILFGKPSWKEYYASQQPDNRGALRKKWIDPVVKVMRMGLETGIPGGGKATDLIKAGSEINIGGKSYKAGTTGFINTRGYFPSGAEEIGTTAKGLARGIKTVAELPVKGIKEGTKYVIKGKEYIFKGGKWNFNQLKAGYKGS